ncbi:hypothetical protein B0H10DRAFT_1396726 [Mycena sp. CBHHK59/15]|nr:hypothetical protein B0H10DRAFT_1396726 [Mycena sp. CBHHK59/15]
MKTFPGQTPSITSINNFINFCALTLPNTALTNGTQNTDGSCNATPIGLIPPSSKMPAAKFIVPPNGGTVAANQNLTIQMNLANLEAGHFTNADTSYFAAPQTLNPQGIIVGHTHFVIEPLKSLGQTELTDPTHFLLFQGVNTAAVNGVVSLTVNKGVPAGFYRLCSINTAQNHQPVIVPIAQHGSLDDCVYRRRQFRPIRG